MATNAVARPGMRRAIAKATFRDRAWFSVRRTTTAGLDAWAPASAYLSLGPLVLR